MQSICSKQDIETLNERGEIAGERIAGAPDLAVSGPLHRVGLGWALDGLVRGREAIPVHVPIPSHRAADLGKVPDPQRVIGVH